MKAPTIYIENASLAYGHQAIFADINLTISPGEWIALLGPSGVGKTSFLRMLAGLTDSNETVDGKIMTENNLPLSQQIAYMGQTDLLLPWLSALDNAALASKLNHRLDKAKLREKAALLLSQMGLQSALHLYPHQLSGGMRQRVALARTLLEDKPIVLMDEPFSALDAITRYKLQDLAARLLKNKTVIFITHDPNEALRLATSVYVMQGQPAQLKCATHLRTDTPRDVSEPDMIALQKALFIELSQMQEAAA